MVFGEAVGRLQLKEREGDVKKTLIELSQKYTVRMSEGLRDRIRNVSTFCLSCYTGRKGRKSLHICFELLRFTLRLTSPVQRTQSLLAQIWV
jgi:hypothetical protein